MVNGRSLQLHSVNHVTKYNSNLINAKKIVTNGCWNTYVHQLTKCKHQTTATQSLSLSHSSFVISRLTLIASKNSSSDLKINRKKNRQENEAGTIWLVFFCLCYIKRTLLSTCWVHSRCFSWSNSITSKTIQAKQYQKH